MQYIKYIDDRVLEIYGKLPMLRKIEDGVVIKFAHHTITITELHYYDTTEILIEWQFYNPPLYKEDDWTVTKSQVYTTLYHLFNRIDPRKPQFKR